MFWQPNPAPATLGGTAPPPAPDDWVKGFLAFYGLAPAPGGADGCVFNSAPVTIDQVLSTVNSQAALVGYWPSTGAKSIAQKVIADAKADKEAQDGADSVNQTIKKKGDIKAEVGKLAKMDMRTLLNVIAKLKQAGTLENIAGLPTADIPDRVGIAILTVNQDFPDLWNKIFKKLGKPDQEAILERTPDDIKSYYSLDKPAKPGEDDDSRPIVVGLDGVEVQAKLTFKSSLAGSLGETEFTVHIGAGGKLSQFELDVTAVKKKIENLKLPGAMIDLEATLSLNATLDNKAVQLDPKATKIIAGAVQVQAKGEIEVQFKTIKLLKNVAFKLAVTAGSGGVSVQPTIEIPIPGS
jgi:hypothetical protein